MKAPPDLEADLLVGYGLGPVEKGEWAILIYYQFCRMSVWSLESVVRACVFYYHM